jgi:hypothetical protein
MNRKLPINRNVPGLNKRKLTQTAALLACALLLGHRPVQAQPNLPESLLAPLTKINEKSVTATISFLASDEMAGRQTPSKELNIASAYVRSRLQSAGLIGGAKDGSFFQTTEIATVRVPTTGISIQQDGKPVQHFGLLSGGKSLQFAGDLKKVSAEDDFRNREFDGPVYFEPGNLDDRRGLFNLMRQTAILKRNGATAIVIPVDADGKLLERARQAEQPSLVTSRGGFAGPTLLVEKLESGANVELKIPPQQGGTAEVHNVIAVLPGSDPEKKDEAILFSAHLDHIGSKSGSGDTIFNGADDDASGVTAVLTLADAFAALETPPKRSIIFMTFWGEEKGLLGSRHFVRYPTWPLDKIVANINIEMIGRPESGAAEKCWMTGWHQSDLGILLNKGSQRVGILTFEHPQFSSMLYRASDNYSFVEAGVIAHSFSAGSLHSDYHQVTDEWEKLEIRHMTRVIQGIFAGSLPIANAEATPRKTQPE